MENITEATVLDQILKDFDITAQCIDVFKHRHFIYYDLKLEKNARVSKIIRCSTEIALALKTKTSIIVNPIPAKGLVRLRSTFLDPEIINLNALLENNTTPKNSILPCLLGETDEGNSFWMDLAQNPHLLMGGSTGSGKSTLLHNIIFNLLNVKNTNVYLVDTKKVEFSLYKENSRIKSIAQNYNDTIDILKYLVNIMNSRYDFMSKNNISPTDVLPFSKIVLIIDEAADLMLHKKKANEFENLLLKLAQQARAAGIYIILATQRPSVDVITGLIKSNFPARISCKVVSKFDSNIILDEFGAENLLGKGDAMVKLPNGQVFRLQIAYPFGGTNGRLILKNN